jgi:hypothetical protein
VSLQELEAPVSRLPARVGLRYRALARERLVWFWGTHSEYEQLLAK